MNIYVIIVIILRIIIFIFVLLLMVRWLIFLYNDHIRHRPTIKQARLLLSNMTNTSSHSFSLYVRARILSTLLCVLQSVVFFLHWFERSLQMSLYGNTNRISSRRWIRRERRNTALVRSLYINRNKVENYHHFRLFFSKIQTHTNFFNFYF
jgi:hypothetical protein